MAEWIELLGAETAATIEGLTGQRPEVSLKEKGKLGEITNIIAPTAVVTIQVSGDLSGMMAMVIPPALGTALSDLMLGGEGESRDTMEEDDLDAVKESVSNIFGALS